MNYTDAIKTRRSIYDLTNISPISNARIKEILSDAITYTPSAFHSQSSRVLLLFGTQHQVLWDIVKETLKVIVPTDKFADTETKLNSFAAGYGTVLFFEDMKTVEQMQKSVPSYAENFPIWSLQSAGMLQYAVWTAFASEGLGASIQHYNPLIDEKVRAEFDVSSDWKLLAQMPFGKSNSTPDALEYKTIDERLFVHGE